MPLLKLWNAIRGRTNNHPVSESDSVKTTPVNPAAKSTRSSTFSVFGAGNPHSALCKLVQRISAKTFLEVSVDDGSRAIAVLETLAKTQENVRYIAIDQFEMAGGAITLKQFHQTLRGRQIRPQVFPEPIERGLARVANTVGAIDLIIIGAAVDQWQTPLVQALLTRISHPETVVFYREDEKWCRYQIEAAQLRRTA